MECSAFEVGCTTIHKYAAGKTFSRAIIYKTPCIPMERNALRYRRAILALRCSRIKKNRKLHVWYAYASSRRFDASSRNSTERRASPRSPTARKNVSVRKNEGPARH